MMSKNASTKSGFMVHKVEMHYFITNNTILKNLFFTLGDVTYKLYVLSEWARMPLPKIMKFMAPESEVHMLRWVLMYYTVIICYFSEIIFTPAQLEEKLYAWIMKKMESSTIIVKFITLSQGVGLQSKAQMDI